MRRLFLAWLAAGWLCACEDPPPPCLLAEHAVDESCAPLYVPTFTNVYEKTLKDGCAKDAACHSAAGQAGDLSMATQDIAYEQLLDTTQGRVKPSDPSCSEMIVRTHSPGEDYQMPPGDPLSGPARCALVQWVLQGALP